MTPLEIRKENLRREAEKEGKRPRLPKRQPAPAAAKAEIERIKAEFEARKGRK